MIEVLKDPAIITAVCSAIGAAAGVAMAIISLVKSRKASKFMQAAKARETYAVCPHCKKKVPLSELPFFLPDGSKDNNLNGVPDIEE